MWAKFSRYTSPKINFYQTQKFSKIYLFLKLISFCWSVVPQDLIECTFIYGPCSLIDQSPQNDTTSFTTYNKCMIQKWESNHRDGTA